MNYNRYLDLFLCTSTLPPGAADGNCFTHRGVQYYHNMREATRRMARYRSREHQYGGFLFDKDSWFSKGNCHYLHDIEVTSTDRDWLRLAADGTFGNRLRQARYIGCFASIERLKLDATYPALQGLVHWICDPTSINKLRIACHGEGTSQGGFGMGVSSLSTDELVTALVRHGLSRGQKQRQDTSGLAHAARWKLDSEVNACEGCRKPFKKTVFSSTKHHCRRCGGIFCSDCSSWRTHLNVALTGANNATEKPAGRVRVCRKCFEDATGGGDRAAEAGELNYGLQTIALCICMAAKADDIFSVEKGAPGAGEFAAGSLAARLLTGLRDRNVRGVKITASNASLTNTEQGTLVNGLLVGYPTDLKAGFASQMADPTYSHYVEYNSKGRFKFPAYIWGKSPRLKLKYEAIQGPKPAFGIVVKDRQVFFGMQEFPVPAARPPSGNAGAADADGQVNKSSPDAIYRILLEFFEQWTFLSWGYKRKDYATDGRPGSPPDSACIVLTPPPRVQQITGASKVPVVGPGGMNITVSGRSPGTYREAKSYGVS
jgi:hypothetical protein